MSEALLYDVTLRDGNHAIRHQLMPTSIKEYCALAEQSQVWAVEVGHGNGLGASSFLVGKSASSDIEMLHAARGALKNKKLAVHAIPGFATIERDLKPAIDAGVDVFRIATHATEASIAEKHIEFLSKMGATVHGVLMMSHTLSAEEIIDQARLLVNFGADGVILMDSAGAFDLKSVEIKVNALVGEISSNIAVGFHAHNNLGLGVANACKAIDAGARIIDGASMGLGAGAGNAQLEAIAANISKGDKNSIELRNFFSMSEFIESGFSKSLPRTTSLSIQSGVSGAFSGYAPHVRSIASEFGLDPILIWEEIGNRKLVAGQESMIREIATDLMNL